MTGLDVIVKRAINEIVFNKKKGQLAHPIRLHSNCPSLRINLSLGEYYF
jgi:hypothetical protein